MDVKATSMDVNGRQWTSMHYSGIALLILALPLLDFGTVPSDFGRQRTSTAMSTATSMVVNGHVNERQWTSMTSMDVNGPIDIH